MLHGETCRSIFALADTFSNIFSLPIESQKPDIKWKRTLLVVSTSDLEEVTLELITERIARNLFSPKNSTSSASSPPSSTSVFPFRRRLAAHLSSHALLHEGPELALIVDFNEFLRPIGRVGDVELHLDEVPRSRRGGATVVEVEVGRGFAALNSCVDIDVVVANSRCGRLTKRVQTQSGASALCQQPYRQGRGSYQENNDAV